ncbi:hypothetical protein BC826DRAFT_1186933 [Russula brevipes]|nr:hypothetical protein BC826DRAFT_1186933 [Russula brevipes]
MSVFVFRSRALVLGTADEPLYALKAYANNITLGMPTVKSTPEIACAWSSRTTSFPDNVETGPPFEGIPGYLNLNSGWAQPSLLVVVHRIEYGFVLLSTAVGLVYAYGISVPVPQHHLSAGVLLARARPAHPRSTRPSLSTRAAYTSPSASWRSPRRRRPIGTATTTVTAILASFAPHIHAPQPAVRAAWPASRDAVGPHARTCAVPRAGPLLWMAMVETVACGAMPYSLQIPVSTWLFFRYSASFLSLFFTGFHMALTSRSG